MILGVICGVMRFVGVYERAMVRTFRDRGGLRFRVERGGICRLGFS